MKAIFIHRECVLRDSHIDPASPPETWRLAPATFEAIRALANNDTLIFLYGALGSREHHTGNLEHEADLSTLVQQIRAGGGRVDGLLMCPHEQGQTCKCWDEFPGIFWAAATQFDLSLNTCYVLANTERDVVTAYAAGMRPLLVLGKRSIGEVLGNLPQHKDFPIATDLTAAVNYITIEEDINRQLGKVRNAPVPLPPYDVLYADPQALPALAVISPLAQGLQTRLRSARAELRDIVRWLTLFMIGALGLSLGIAYMLTHLYRIQPFHEFVYFVTLQFISRPLRGALFIGLGIAALLIAIRSFYRSAKFQLWRKRRP